jgi:hypothetical protein
MTFIQSAKSRLAEELKEQALYETAANEIAAKNFNKGIYAKAIALSQGDYAKLDSLYLTLRVKSLQLEANATDELIAEYERAQRATELNRATGQNSISEKKKFELEKLKKAQEEFEKTAQYQRERKK